MTTALASKKNLETVRPGTEEAAIIEEELDLLARVQKQLAKHSLDQAAQTEYDRELLALRDQIAEAHMEDLAPLIAEMYRMQALGQANGKGRDLPVDVNCPYFGHLKLNDGKKVRDVLIGSRGFVKPGSEVAIVDWRNAPVSRIYYRYEEGDDYEEEFGKRMVNGVVEARRTISIVNGELRSIKWSTGAVRKNGKGEWMYIPVEAGPILSGGAGIASRPPADQDAPSSFNPGKLGIVGDESLREDKHLREITALIDPKQFELITSPDSGIVILQGGAGSGKTTVALHRAAYLHYNNPNVFSPKKMAVVVKSEPLTEYISRVLPSLDVQGTQVITLDGWMQRTRQKVLPEIKRKYTTDTPPSVARLKKHPAVLALLERGVALEADSIESELAKKLKGEAVKTTRTKWRSMRRLALLPRIREMSKWIDGAGGNKLKLNARLRSTLQGVLRRAKSAGQDIYSAWADFLTDRDLLTEALDQKGWGVITPDDVNELIKWVGLQSEEPVEDEPKKVDKNADADEEDDEDTSFNYGVDGRRLDEDAPFGKLDEHDDALLLKLTQLRYGGLPITGSSRTVTYEHVIVDEAQDLSATDVAVLKGALSKRESMTLAGDTAQKLIFDNGFEDWETMLKNVGVEGVKIDQLRISYRSTREIVLFARHVLGPLADPEAPIVPRTGAPVEQFQFGSTGEGIAFLGEALRSLVLRERKANVAVVTRYAAQAEMYYQGLRKSEVPALRRVYGKNFSFQPGIDVVDVAQIKGLEYDYVVLAEVNANTFPALKEARHLLHIAATRAVHQLWVTSVGDRSPLLPEAF
ncbi:MAG: 3'-5' exonuclease [Myxococcota bacterium]